MKKNAKSFNTKILEKLECVENFKEIKEKLMEYKKYEDFQSEIIGKIIKFICENSKYFCNDEKDFLSLIDELIENNGIIFECKLIPKLNLPQINNKTKSGYNTLDNEDKDEFHLRKSVNNLEHMKNEDLNKIKIVWKSCQEIFPDEELVILPEKLDHSCFNQGHIGDCYFITCIHALSDIPQLLNYILRLSTKDQNNQIEPNQEDFKVNFFIDGEWKIINIKNNFPIIKKKDKEDELLGVTPNKNELFLMILEKAWAKINGGYDKIEGGTIYNIFELFLGCKCDYYKDFEKGGVFVNSFYERIKLNEKFYGNLSQCSSIYYDVDKKFLKEMKENQNIKYTFDKNECLLKNKIKFDGGHAYNIKKTKEIIVKPNNDEKQNYYAFNTVKFLIISNPHGKNSDLVGSGIELKKISEILKKKFGEKNKQYKDILDINKKYEETGIIYMPLDYFKEWCSEGTVCYAHYDCLNYTLDINNELEYLYIYKIKSKKRQYFTCQICFPSFRAHNKEIDELYISLEIDGKNIHEENMFLFYSRCCIKIIKNENFSNVEKPYFSDDLDLSSIKEIKTLLEKGEYIVMIYMESTLNKAILRFLSEGEINIYLVNKIQKGEKKKEFTFNSLEDIKKLFNNYDYMTYFNLINKKNITSCNIKAQDFLPGIRQYYLYFKKLAKSLNLNPEDAIYSIKKDLDPIYSINKDGDVYNYSIVEPNTMIKIFGIKKGKTEISDIIPLNTLVFRDNYGNPYKVNNIKELTEEIKINKNPFSCLLNGYDEKNKILKSGIVHLKVFKNTKKNEDILVITDNSGNFIRREQKPLIIIMLDTSKSLRDYYENLQNKIIPKLLNKLGYSGLKGNFQELYELIKENKISMFELLNIWTSKIKRDNFLKENNLKDVYSEEKIKEIEKVLQDVIILITFSDDSQLLFLDKSQFEDIKKSGLNTYFLDAANHLKNILDNINTERSIRLLCFSDGEIYDGEESKKKLDEILNSTKKRHQIKSLSIRVCHEKANPDTKLLMKLSNFSYPMSGMDLVDIDPNKIEEVVEKLSEILENDGTDYNLKLLSSELLMSCDFSDKFTHEQYYNKRNYIFRVCGGHKPITYYRDLIKNGKLKVSTGQEIKIDDGGDLNEKIFNKMMKSILPTIAQKNLEEKVNKNKDKINQSIKNYLKETGSGLKYNPTDYLDEIDTNEEIDLMNLKEISEHIIKVKEDAEERIYRKEAEFLKEEKNNLKNKIKKLLPSIDKEIMALNKKTKVLNKSKFRKKNICLKDDPNFDINSNSRELETEIDSKDKIIMPTENKEKRNESRIQTSYDNNNELDNLIYDKNIIIEKEKFINGYHQIISLKSNNDNDSFKKSEKDNKNEIVSELDEFQNKIIECLEKRENILFTSNEFNDKIKIAQSAIKFGKAKGMKIIYACRKESLSKRKFHELKEFNDIGIITEDVIKIKHASCIVLTVELLRNMFFKKNYILNNLLNEVNLVIFDDIYHIKNTRNISFLEEIIIFLKNEINFLFISSPFPNMKEFGIWMTRLKKEKFNILNSALRSINLRHYILTDSNYNKQSDLVLILESRLVKNENIPQSNTEEIFYDEHLNQAFEKLEYNEVTNNKKIINKENENLNMDLINLIKKLYFDKFCPVVIFCSSKNECEKNTRDLFQYIQEYNKLKDKKKTKKTKTKITKTKITKTKIKLKKKAKDTNNQILFNKEDVKEAIKNEYNRFMKIKEQTDDFSNYLSTGIGYYHNDMLSFQKELVEIFFQKGYIKVLFSNENFNLPSKTILLTTLFKVKENRFLTGNEYYLITERVGRNKNDKFGNIIIMLNKNIKKEEYLSIIKGKQDPLNSCFKLSFNLFANLMRANFKIQNLLPKTFYQFQLNRNILILQKKLINIFCEYLKNDFKEELREVKIKELFEMKNSLRDLKKIYFNPNNFEQHLCFGRIIKIKYFGLGIMINKEKKLYNEKNNFIATEYNLNKIKNHRDDLIINEEENLNLDFNDIDENNEEIIINNKYLRNKIFFQDIIEKYKKSLNENNEDENIKDNDIDEISEKSQNNDKEEFVLDILVSLKPYRGLKDFLCPGNFEFDSFHGIIPFCISMVEEIYDVSYEIEIDSKEKIKIENLAKYLKDLKIKYKDKLPVLDILNEYKNANGIKDINDLRVKIKDEELLDSLIEISEMEKEYNQLKSRYMKEYIIPVKKNNKINYDLENEKINDNMKNNIEFELDLEKYNKNKKLIEKLEKILTRLELKNNSGLKIQLPKIKNCLFKMDIISKGTKEDFLTEKGHLMCDIQHENNIILSELFYSKYDGNLTLEKIGLIICCCLNKKTPEKKGINKNIINKNEYPLKEKEKNNILDFILGKAKEIAEIFEQCKIFKTKEDKIKFINNFNDNYMEPIYKWIKSDKKKYKFNQLIEESNGLYAEESLINIFKKIKKISEYLGGSVCLGGMLKDKIKRLGDKIMLGLPLMPSLYLE